MTFWRKRSTRVSLALALLVSVGLLLGPASSIHSHDGGFSGHCEVCRLANAAAPALVVLLVILLTLPETGRTVVPVAVFRSQTARRCRRARGPPLV